MCKCTCMCLWRPEVDSKSLVLKQILLLNLELMGSAGLAGQGTYLYPPSTEIRGLGHGSQIFTCILGF